MANDILSQVDPDINVFDNIKFSSVPISPLPPSDLHLHLSNSNNYFSFLHLNVRNLYNKITQLSILLKEINICFSVIGISETWLDNISAPLISLPNYNFVSCNRETKTGGGVGIFISEQYNYILRNDLCL